MPPPHHVLVVDDDPDIAESVQLILELDGFEVETTANGREALAAIERRMPAVILLDMLMPIMNGWELAAELARRYPRRPPIIVVTAAEDARVRAEEVAAEDFLKKPFDVTMLRTKVREQLARSVHEPRRPPAPLPQRADR